MTIPYKLIKQELEEIKQKCNTLLYIIDDMNKTTKRREKGESDI